MCDIDWIHVDYEELVVVYFQHWADLEALRAMKHTFTVQAHGWHAGWL